MKKSGTLKYEIIYDWVVSNIRSEKLLMGNKLPSEDEMCEQFSVSRQTVRNALEILERNNYIVRRQGSGSYVSYQVLHKDKTVGIFLTYLSDYIYSNIIQGAEKILTEEGYGMDLTFSHNKIENERKFLNRMLEKNVAGVIVEGVKTAFPNPNLDLYKELQAREIPVIFMHNYYEGLCAPSVLMEDQKLAYDLTMMLIEAGHKNIMGCFKYDDIQGHWRYFGYVKALQEKGIPIQEENIFWFGDIQIESEDLLYVYKRESLALGISDRMSDCTAIICYNDLIASFIAKEIFLKGLSIPNDLSIVGFDDNMIQYNKSLKITSAKHPKELLGIKVASELLKMANNPELIRDNNSRFFMEMNIVERDSIKQIL